MSQVDVTPPIDTNTPATLGSVTSVSCRTPRRGRSQTSDFPNFQIPAAFDPDAPTPLTPREPPVLERLQEDARPPIDVNHRGEPHNHPPSVS